MNQTSPSKISSSELSRWLDSSSVKPVLIDVREDNELSIAPFSFPVVHLPLSKASIWIDDLSKKVPTKQPVVVICHSGIRSWNFGIWLLEQSLGYEVWNLEGGIDNWSLNVDPSIPRY